MGILQEFKDFAIKGNMIDMAVGIIIGGAFGLLIKSLVTDVIMPPVGLAMGGIDFSKDGYTLKEAVAAAPATATTEAVAAQEALVWTYGNFIQTGINFLIVAFCVFLLVKAVNSMKKKEEAAPAAPPAQEVLLEEIRDLLKKA